MTFQINQGVSDANPIPISVTGDGMRVDSSSTVTIPNGQSLSAAIDLDKRVLTRIEFPSAWTAAGLTFQISTDGVTYRDLFDENSEVTFPAGANRAIHVGSFGWFTVRYLKFRSGTSAAPVNQTADRVLDLYSGYQSS